MLNGEGLLEDLLSQSAGSLNFSVSEIIAGLLFGTLGFWIFKKSREKMNVKLSVIGVSLFFWPYIPNNIWVNWLGGLALCALAWKWWNEE